jgi:hypothetical protein
MIIRTLLALSFLTLAGETLHAQARPELVQMPVQVAYMPRGFDSNDRTQLVVESYLPNTCYKVGPHKVQVDASSKAIKVEQWVYRYPGICLQVIVPFHKVVDIGILDAKDYQILDAKSGDALGTLSVTRAINPGPDDYLYAPVTDARVETKSEEERVLIVEGVFNNSCFGMDNIKVDVQAKVVVVLPIAKETQGEACKEGKFAFKIEQPLPKLNFGRYLLHVRSMNGQAINKLFDADRIP